MTDSIKQMPWRCYFVLSVVKIIIDKTPMVAPFPLLTHAAGTVLRNMDLVLVFSTIVQLQYS